MSGISDAIGNEFERQIQEMFPDWVATMDGKLLPDFDSPHFWAEAKTGFYDFGVQIKEYQINAFRSLMDPVIYVLGFHTFNNAVKRLERKSDEERAKILKRQMSLDSVYFVEQSVVEKVWDKEHRISKKEGRVYCTLKKRFLDGIVEDARVRRNGSVLNSLEYYGLKKSDLILLKPAKTEGVPVTSILRANQQEISWYLQDLVF